MMTIKQIFNLAIKLGIEHDLRGATAVRKKLQREKEKYAELPAVEKREFDIERLTNPFSDSRLFSQHPDKPVRRALVGIDIGTEEVLLARELSKDKPIDFIISHHPVGPALAGLHEVMHMQAEVLALYDVPINIAEHLITIRLEEVSRSVASANHARVLDAARLLGFDLMCAHTATDNLVASFLQREIKRHARELEYVGDVMKFLKQIPEYRQAMELKAGPMLFAGSPERHTGKIAISEVTGGTSGSKDIYEKMAQAGIGTIIGMHMHEEHKKEAEKYHMNVIIAGHMSSDSLGMNFYLDELEKRSVEIIPCAGLIRVKRFKARPKPRRR